tara:strand:+ start:459 stop:857 length:399 start_codon:yes stop_codon:yes gene_type:complete
LEASLFYSLCESYLDITTDLVPDLLVLFVLLSFVFSDVFEQDFEQDDFSPCLAQDFIFPSFEQQAFFSESVFPLQQVSVFLLEQVSLHVFPVFAQTFSVLTFSLADGSSDCAEAVKAKNANAPSNNNFLILT